MDAPQVSRPANRYILPTELRSELRGDFGPIHQTDSLAQAIDGAPVVAVGDHVSLTLKELGIAPRAFVCDFHTQRGQLSENYLAALGNWGDTVHRVENPAGEITAAAWDACVAAATSDGMTRIEVAGEEDLLALPLFLLLPIGWKLIYGVPNVGVGVVSIDVELKARIADLIGRMESA